MTTDTLEDIASQKDLLIQNPPKVLRSGEHCTHCYPVDGYGGLFVDEKGVFYGRMGELDLPSRDFSEVTITYRDSDAGRKVGFRLPWEEAVRVLTPSLVPNGDALIQVAYDEQEQLEYVESEGQAVPEVHFVNTADRYGIILDDAQLREQIGDRLDAPRRMAALANRLYADDDIVPSLVPVAEEATTRTGYEGKNLDALFADAAAKIPAVRDGGMVVLEELDRLSGQ